MKVIAQFFIFLFLINCPSIYGQKLKIQIQNTNGKIDSVLLGIDINASLGVDTQFGEKKLDIQQDTSNFIFIAQRDSSNYHCLNSGFPDYLPIFYNGNNFDSKVNFRNSKSPNDLYFEMILSPKFQATSTIIILSSQSHLDSILEFVSFDFADCTLKKGESHSFNNSQSYMYSFIGSQIHNIIIKFKSIPTTTYHVVKESERLYKFANNILYFNHDMLYKNIFIASVDGKLLKIDKLVETFDFSDLPSGYYIISAILENGSKISKGFVKL